jgi:Cytochrome c554 and c-prime
MKLRYAKEMLVVVILLATPSLRAQESATSLTESQSSRRNYVGDDACRECHPGETQNYLQTPHHRTSRPPSKESILGSFAEDKNILNTANAGLYFRMDSRADGFYETAVSMFPAGSVRSERIDVVIGSGRVGQTYLYWSKDQLFQLPVSYWVDLDAWVNSPGYRDGTANFERPVVPRCLECHLTYAEATEPSIATNRYKPATLVLGISCERCHGPGREHMERSRENKTSAGFSNPRKLTRDRQIELCAQCHGGRRIPQTVPFSYLPGEPLDKYYQRDPKNTGVTADVHGNQVALLQMSRCYQASAQMTCSTCHDAHKAQRDVVVLSERCVVCHAQAEKSHKFTDKKMGACVDCHMPVQLSNLIISNSNGKRTRALVRTHWIKVYPDAGTR